MRLVKASWSEIEGSNHYKYGSAQKIVMEFVHSDLEIARVEHDGWGENTSGASVLKSAIKKLKVAGVEALQHNGNAYLIKTDKL